MAIYNRKIILGISDSHSGFALGLTNPETLIKDQDGNDHPITLNEPQKFLWEDAYIPGLQDVADLADGDDIVAIIGGDVTHGNKYISEQLNTRMANQIAYARYSFFPVYRIKGLKQVRFCAGTGAHSFGEASGEILVSDMLKLDFPNIDTRIVYHGLLKLGEFEIDYAHHGPYTGSRNWLKGNVARYYLQSLVADDLDAGVKPPNLVLRGHYHEYIRAWAEKKHDGKFYESWLVVMPPLCLPGDFTHQATRSMYRVSPGIVAFELINDKLVGIYPLTKTLDIRTVEKL